MELGTAPVLSTPDSYIFDESAVTTTKTQDRPSDEQLLLTYEIQRTVQEIRAGTWKRIALQFPDHMLVDGPRVFQALSRGLKQARKDARLATNKTSTWNSAEVVDSQAPPRNVEERLYILADTSYGACCVDEVAAEHAEADVVVHYGRSCLSPTARLPVIYVFTKPPLDIEVAIKGFEETYNEKNKQIILMADIPYNSYLPEIATSLTSRGYTDIFTTDIIHNSTSPLPNRTIPEAVTAEPSILNTYSLFHISDPPPSLLLTLSSRLSSIYILPTNTSTPKPTLATSHTSLRRRYALLTSLSTTPIFGILINTLSVKSYLTILNHLKRLIAAAGKKSYTFVVGKVNAAKIANFSEVGGWVVVGCWESSLFESRDFWKPVVTPWELELCLKGDDERVWSGAWSSDFQDVLRMEKEREGGTGAAVMVEGVTTTKEEQSNETELEDSEEESEPPEFDLRTGKYVSHSRPMGRSQPTTSSSPALGNTPQTSTALLKRANGDLATINGVVSPSAEYFKNKRTWQGLGSDYEIKYDEEDQGAKVEQGRKGIARGYVVGDDEVKR